MTHKTDKGFVTTETMNVLALETSCRNASVAVLENDRLLSHCEFGSSRRTAQAFAPEIAGQLSAVGWCPGDVQLIVVSQGPGSFTGLRVGVTAAKTLAYATGAPVLGVNTQQVIAYQAEGDWEEITVVGDAGRQQLFVDCFRRIADRLEPACSPGIVDISAWLQSLDDGQWVTGPGLSQRVDQLPAGVRSTTSADWLPRAATLGRIGYSEFQAGRRDDLWNLKPIYYRPSAAEEKLAQR